MSTSPWLGLAGVVAILAGCAGELRYRPAGLLDNHGYRDKVAGPNEYSVTVTGDVRTSAQRVAEIALLRAAYITRGAGCTHFVIMHSVETARPEAHLQTVSVFSEGTLLILPVTTVHSSEPICVLLLRLLPADKSLEPNAIDAQRIIDLLRPRLETP